MVRIKSYKCDHCARTTSLRRICLDCAQLFCYACNGKIEKQEIISKCVASKTKCNIVRFDADTITYLKECAPEDELKLLNFGKWNPFFLRRVRMKRRLAHVADMELNCVNCVPPGATVNVRDDHPLLKIMGELKEYFTNADEECDVIRTGIQLENWKCSKCKDNYYKFLQLRNGDIFCLNCLPGNSIPRDPDCWDQFQYFLGYIPQVEDLKLLTYSKSTPLKCERCSVLLSEKNNQIPTHHQCCKKLLCKTCSSANCECCKNPKIFPVMAVVDVIKEFRALFKNGGWDIETTDTKPKLKELFKVNEGCSLTFERAFLHTEGLNSLTTNVADGEGAMEVPSQWTMTQSYLPTRIRCLNCGASRKNGICSYCVTKNHWGHKIIDTEKEMMRVSFQNESDETFSKMTRWKADVDTIHLQGSSIQNKLCESYRKLFTTSLDRGHVQLLHAIHNEGNVVQLQSSVKDYITYGIRLNNRMQHLDDSLTLLLQEANEKHDGSTEHAQKERWYV